MLNMHPFDRTCFLVANRPARASSLLSPACSTEDYSSNAIKQFGELPQSVSCLLWDLNPQPKV